MNDLKSSEDFVDAVILPREAYDKLLSDSVKLNLIRDSIKSTVKESGPSCYGLVNDALVLNVTGLREFIRTAKDLERKDAAT